MDTDIIIGDSNYGEILNMKGLYSILKRLCENMERNITVINVSDETFKNLSTETIQKDSNKIKGLKIKDFHTNSDSKIADFLFNDKLFIIAFLKK